MGAIAGILYLDGRHTQEQEIGLMVAAMAHRGPDSMHTWCKGQVGLGHCMLHTTPESLTERLPLSSEDGRYAITADARIDNREELATALGLDGPSARAMADSGYILAAYVRWGDTCVEKLIGDFAFAIWDSDRRRLFCARDPIGVRAFYYHQSSHAFAFATEIRALFALPWVPQRVDELRVAEYLVRFTEDRQSTFYQDVVALSAAHTLALGAESPRHAQYWRLNPDYELRLASETDYVESFRETFFEAVRCRMRTAYSVGSTLSGGLDSSSIACVARQIMAAPSSGGQKALATFSLVFPGLPDEERKRSDESAFIKTVLAKEGFDPHFIEADQLSPLFAMRAMQSHSDGPDLGFNLYLHRAMFVTAQRASVRVLLDGTDGDSTLSYGYEHLLGSFVTLAWRRLWQDLRLLRDTQGASRKQLVAREVVEPLLGYKLLPTIAEELGARPWLANNCIDRAFAQRVGLAHRYAMARKGLPGWIPNARRLHCQGIGSGMHQMALQMLDAQSAPFGVQPAYPFYDRRLVDLCVAMPSVQKFGDGTRRPILRSAMQGILPEQVRKRRGKGHLGRNLQLKLLTIDRNLVEDVLVTNRHLLEGLISLPLLDAACARFQADPAQAAEDDVMAVMQATLLGTWLGDSGLLP